MRIGLRQGAATYMIHLTVGQAVHLSASLSQSPTEVYLLIMCEETSVKTANLPIVVAPDHETGTRSPKHLCGSIILSVVLFHRIKYPASAERIAITVNESTACTSIFKAVMVVYCQQFRLTSRHIRMAVHKFHQRRKPVVGHLYIGVEQHIVFRLYVGESLIISVGKTPVLLQHYQRHVGMVLSQPFHGVVGRRVVGNNDRGILL